MDTRLLFWEVNMFPGKFAIQQRVLPDYRAAFFDLLAGLCRGGLSLFAGDALPEEGIVAASGLEVAHYTWARNRSFLHPGSPLYLCWQQGITAWL